jgi:hypothetical protein
VQDLSKNTSTVVHKERNVHLSGVKFCKKQQLLFVAGTLSGKAFLYHMQRTAGPKGATYSLSKREVLDLNLPGKSYINDVAVSQDRVYFTDSFNPVLYQVPRFFGNSASSQQRFALSIMGASGSRPIVKVKTGPYFDTKVGQFRANGIAVYKTNERKDVLLVANTHTGHLYKVVVDKTVEPVADATAIAASTGTQKAVAAMAQQATMAVSSRLRLGRPTAATTSSSSSDDSSDEDSFEEMPEWARVAAAVQEAEEQQQLLLQQIQAGKKPDSGNSSTTTKPLEVHAQARTPPANQTKAVSAAATAKAAPKAAAAGKPKAAGAAASAAAAAAAVATAAGKAQGSKPGGQDSNWSKLAKDVATLNSSQQLKAAQQKQGRKVVPAAATAAGAAAVPAVPGAATSQTIEDAAAAAVQAVQVGSYLTKLARDVRSRMRVAGKPQDEDITPAAASSSSSSGGSVQGMASNRRGFTARPSADAFVKAGKRTSKRNERGSRAKPQGKIKPQAMAEPQALEPAVLLAEPVRISEPVLDINAAVRALAATQAAVAVATVQQQKALGRMLMSAADTDNARFTWPPAQMARGIAEKLGFTGRHKQVVATVQELKLPSIPGQYTQRLLVDGIVVKNDTAYVADNYNDRVWGLQLGKGLSDVKVVCVIKGPLMHVPTTMTMVGGRLWWVNAHLDTCFPFLPCPAHSFELHGISPGMCQPWNG